MKHSLTLLQLKSNRTAAASSALIAVRDRHNDIQKIEKTLIEINQLFQDLSQSVTIQEPMVHDVENQVEQTYHNTQGATKKLGTAADSARRARRLRWICFWVTIIGILIIVAVAVAIVKTRS
jgi:syntaxin 1B/2/3